MQPCACLKSPSYYGMSSYTVQERKRQGHLQAFVSDSIFLWTLPFLSGLKCLHTDGTSRKAKGVSQEQYKTFTRTGLNLDFSLEESKYWRVVSNTIASCILPCFSAISSSSKKSQTPYPPQFSPVLPEGPDWELCPGASQGGAGFPLHWHAGLHIVGCLGAPTVDSPLAAVLAPVPLFPLVTGFV